MEKTPFMKRVDLRYCAIRCITAPCPDPVVMTRRELKSKTAGRVFYPLLTRSIMARSSFAGYTELLMFIGDAPQILSPYEFTIDH